MTIGAGPVPPNPAANLAPRATRLARVAPGVPLVFFLQIFPTRARGLFERLFWPMVI